jgi:hypothetical protein
LINQSPRDRADNRSLQLQAFDFKRVVTQDILVLAAHGLLASAEGGSAAVASELVRGLNNAPSPCRREGGNLS